MGTFGVLAVLAMTLGAQAQTVATTTSLAVSKAATAQGENLTLVANVTGSSPTGAVTFKDGATTLGTSSITGADVATFSTSSLALGSHSLTASYAGNTNNVASTSTAVTVTVNAKPPMTWQYGYDAMGRPNTVVDPNGQSTFFYYDSLGRRIQTQQPPNTGSSTPTVTQFGYNGRDDLTSVADPRNLSTTYSRNGLGQTNTLVSPDTGTTTYTYDAKGNVLTSTDARGKTTTYTYDALDRVKTISYPTGTPTAFEYDGGANPTPAAAGELTRITDASGSTTYTHDSLGRVIGKTVVIGSRTFTVGYTWGDTGSALDKLTSITYPSGSRVNYSYDQYGSISGITVNPVNANGQGTSSTTTTLLSGITYNAEGKITGWLWSDGKARTIGYDSNGLISSYTLGDPMGIGNAAGVLRTINRNAAGRITGYTHTNNGAAVPSLDQVFTYDNLNRLITATIGSASYAYSYDETGNRTSKTIGGNTYTNTIAPTSNRMTQAGDVGGTATINHDNAGHITGDGANTYSYDDRGRMVSVTTSIGSVNDLYNGLEQRAGKSGPTNLIPTGASYYLFDEGGQLLGEYDAAGNPLYETIYLGSAPTGVMKQTGSAANSDLALQLYNLYAEHIDTARVITRQDHAIVWRWDAAEAFGATAPDQNPSSLGTFTFNQRFPGQVLDAETGLFQNWHREYQARWGRYAQSDPIGLAGGINTFAYASGDPTSYVDPTGLETTVVCRSVNHPLAKILGSKHCFVVVWHWKDVCDIRMKIVDGQYSLAGNRTVYRQGSNAETYRADTEAWNSGSPAESYEVPPPSGVSGPAFDREVARQATAYDSGREYDARFGPNSNTATQQIIERAGGSLPSIPGARAQNWRPPQPRSR
ncbi:MAG TPA: RHS repeat-associated core domain-containing protein [Ramlibacter sp.]|uniref:RHS repeat-associated core domain-containing protein n=1 Tax=Ramlibacter sp. TaxID=1917967 RepID=UPI002ED3E848